MEAFFDTKLKIQQWLDIHQIKAYTIHNDLTVDVKGHVNLSHQNLTYLPIQFGIVQGSFRIDGNNLTSLKGSPMYVGESFDCSCNNLINLKYLSKYIGDSLDASHNNLIHIEDLVHCMVRREIDLQYNKITSLKGSPEKASHKFNCSYNELINLIGGPKEAPDHYFVSHNKITSLIGAPEVVHGNFDVSYNQLINLEHAPKTVWEEFDVSHNKIQTIEHLALIECRGTIDISHNQISSLLGAPQKVVRNFDCSFNQLASLEFGPMEVGRDYLCESNQLISFKGMAKKVATIYASSNQINSLIDIKNCILNSLDLANNKISTLKDINPNLYLFNVRNNPLDGSCELLFLEGIKTIMFNNPFDDNKEHSLYSPEEVKSYMDKLRAYVEQAQLNESISLHEQGHRKMKI